MAERGRVGTTVSGVVDGGRRRHHSLTTGDKNILGPIGGGHGIGLGGMVDVVGTGSVRKAAMPRDEPGRKKCSEAMGTGAGGGGVAPGRGRGSRISSPTSQGGRANGPGYARWGTRGSSRMP